MYLARLFVDNRLMGVRCYEEYEHALFDTVSGSPALYAGWASEIDGVAFSKPTVIATAEDDLDYGVDFKFCYPGGVVVSIEKILQVDWRI
ncbi:MAG: hypothetical protein J6M33_02355 [Anaerovibrio sp.]|nr:hypothetical protein [Anaerovibrio sp.]